MIAQIGWMKTGPNCHIQSHVSALSNSDNRDDNIGIRQLVRTPNNTPSLVSRSSGLRWRVAHLLPSNLSIAKIHESCADLSMRLRFWGAWGTQTLFRSVEILLPVSRHGVSSFSLALPQAVVMYFLKSWALSVQTPSACSFDPETQNYLICRFKSNCIIWSCQHRKLNRWLEVSEVWGCHTSIWETTITSKTYWSQTTSIVLDRVIIFEEVSAYRRCVRIICPCFLKSRPAKCKLLYVIIILFRL